MNKFRVFKYLILLFIIPRKKGIGELVAFVGVNGSPETAYAQKLTKVPQIYLIGRVDFRSGAGQRVYPPRENG